MSRYVFEVVLIIPPDQNGWSVFRMCEFLWGFCTIFRRKASSRTTGGHRRSAQTAVNRALEVAEETHGVFVHKRQELHQQYGANRTLRIDPVEGVVEPGPRQASGGAASRVRRGIDEESQ